MGPEGVGVGRRSARGSHRVGDQPAQPNLVLPDDHGGLGDAGVARQRRFDLP